MTSRVESHTEQISSPSTAHQQQYTCRYPLCSTSIVQLIAPDSITVEATLGVLKGQVWLNQKGCDKPICLDRDVYDDKLVMTVLVKERDDLYCFVGFYKFSELWIWKNGKPLAAGVVPKSVKLKGLCAVSVCQPLINENQVVFLLATGLGIGHANIWKLVWPRLQTPDLTQEDTTAKFEHLGVIQAAKSISSMQFGTTGETVIMMSDFGDSPAIRLHSLPVTTTDEKFEQKQGQGAKLLASEFGIALGSEELGRALQAKELAYRNPMLCQDGIASYEFLFPKRLLFEDAYEGETNAAGEPHGSGTQLIKSENADYSGEWRNGYRHGLGKMINPTTKELLFEGRFVKHERNGLGKEFKDKEVYVGLFSGDVRHGFGTLNFVKAGKVGGVAVAAGATCRGFFKNGRLHGWARMMFPRTQFELTKTSRNDIGCVAEFQTGVCHAEFWFHFVDAENKMDCCPKDVNENNLIVRKLNLLATERRFCGPRICWVCLGQGEAMKCCEDCGFVVHARCFDGTHCPYDVEPWNNEIGKQDPRQFRLIDINAAKKLKQIGDPVGTSVSIHGKQGNVAVKSMALNGRVREAQKAEYDALGDHGAVRENDLASCKKSGDEAIQQHRRGEVAKRRAWRSELEQMKEELSKVDAELKDAMEKQQLVLASGKSLFLPATVNLTGDDELAAHEMRLTKVLDELLALSVPIHGTGM